MKHHLFNQTPLSYANSAQQHVKVLCTKIEKFRIRITPGYSTGLYKIQFNYYVITLEGGLRYKTDYKILQLFVLFHTTFLQP